MWVNSWTPQDRQFHDDLEEEIASLRAELGIDDKN